MKLYIMPTYKYYTKIDVEEMALFYDMGFEECVCENNLMPVYVEEIKNTIYVYEKRNRI